MKVAYIFTTNNASTYKLATMILPQLEQNTHGVNVAGMMFFDDNIFMLKKGDPIGERLAKVALDQNILLMICDQCAVLRGMAEGELQQCGSGEVKAKGTVDGVVAGCFPQLYETLAVNPPDQVISL